MSTTEVKGTIIHPALTGTGELSFKLDQHEPIADYENDPGQWFTTPQGAGGPSIITYVSGEWQVRIAAGGGLIFLVSGTNFKGRLHIPGGYEIVRVNTGAIPTDKTAEFISGFYLKKLS